MPEPLHWVIAAPTAVAGNGLQPDVTPSPEPTHWFTVTGDAPGLTAVKLLVTWTLQRSTLPPPPLEPLHCVTAVTGWPSASVVVVQTVSGAPAAP